MREHGDAAFCFLLLSERAHAGHERHAGSRSHRVGDPPVLKVPSAAVAPTSSRRRPALDGSPGRRLQQRRGLGEVATAPLPQGERRHPNQVDAHPPLQVHGLIIADYNTLMSTQTATVSHLLPTPITATFTRSD